MGVNTALGYYQETGKQIIYGAQFLELDTDQDELAETMK